MESNGLFAVSSQGYNCEQVDQYVARLRAEYKKVYDYAKTVESNNEKIKKLYRSLADENAALKAASAAQAGDDSVVIKAASELERIAAELKASAAKGNNY